MENNIEITHQTHATTLYEAALENSIPALNELLRKDRFILDRCIIEKSCIAMQSPLHVAVKMGHLKFVEKILSVKPEMAEVVDQIKRSTPLHIAAARKERAGLAEAAGQDHIAAAGKEREGLAKAAAQDHIAAAAAGKERAGLAKAAVQDNEKIIEILLEVAPNMCFVHDQDGMTPLHVAAVNGNTEVLKQLLKKKHQAALERTTKGETILHLCVKNCQVDTLEALVKDTYDLELLNSGDNDGNTVLHLAVAYKEFKMLKFLLDQGDDKIDKNALNKKNRTMKDIFHLTESAKDSRDKKTLTQSLCTIFGRKREEVEADKSKDESKEEDKKLREADENIHNLLREKHALRSKKVLKRTEDEKWLEEQNTALMVVASCIATLSFQVGINPPGSVWTDNEKGHVAGTSIMSYDTDKDSYNLVQVSNTIGLMSSLSVILLLISGLPCKRHFVFILRVTLWIAVTASAVTYFYTIGYITNELGDKAALVDAMEYSVEVWLWLMMVILFGHGLRFIWNIMGHKKRKNIKETLKSDQWSRYC